MDSSTHFTKATETKNGNALWENFDNDREKLQNDFADFDNAEFSSSEQVAFSTSRAQVDIDQLPSYSKVGFPAAVRRSPAGINCDKKTKWILITTIIVTLCITIIIFLSVYVTHRTTDDHGACSPLPCRNGATCLDDNNVFHCVCPAGYSGQRCEIDLDECSSSPCSHGATCQDGNNEYVCQCQAGYSGATCDVDVDDCQSSPCLHGGLCHDEVAGYTCVCDADHIGKNCQEVVTAQHVCSNGAILFPAHSRCYTIVENGTMTRAEAGTACEGMNAQLVSVESADEMAFLGQHFVQGRKYITSAVWNPYGFRWASDEVFGVQDPLFGPVKPNYHSFGSQYCVGALKNGTNTHLFTRECTERGPYICESPTSQCLTHPCINGGECRHFGSSDLRCECQQGFRGSYCEVDINECASNPCNQQSGCQDGINKYECIQLCRAQFIYDHQLGRCYYVHQMVLHNWADAHEICEFRGATLVSLESDTEGIEVTSLFTQPDEHHLTSARREQDGQFYWSTGAVVTASHLSWAPGEPRAHYDCASIKREGNSTFLYSVDCNTPRLYVCESIPGINV